MVTVSAHSEICRCNLVVASRSDALIVDIPVDEERANTTKVNKAGHLFFPADFICSFFKSTPEIDLQAMLYIQN